MKIPVMEYTVKIFKLRIATCARAEEEIPGYKNMRSSLSYLPYLIFQ